MLRSMQVRRFHSRSCQGKSFVMLLCLFSCLCASSCRGWTIMDMKLLLSMNNNERLQKERTGSTCTNMDMKLRSSLSEVSSLRRRRRPFFPSVMTSVLFGCLSSSFFVAMPVLEPIDDPVAHLPDTPSGIVHVHRAFVAQAACLQGDTSKECIGVYKIPNDGKTTTIMPPTTTTADDDDDDLNSYSYVPPLSSPKSVQDALQILQAQRKALEDIQQVVLAGRFEEAGIKLLNVMPRVTTAGRLMVQFMSSSSSSSSSPADNGNINSPQASTTTTTSSSSRMVVQELQQSRAQSQLENLLALLGQCDVTMGQGLRGEMGSVTMAQLSILSEVKDVIRALDDFVALVVPK